MATAPSRGYFVANCTDKLPAELVSQEPEMRNRLN